MFKLIFSICILLSGIAEGKSISIDASRTIIIKGQISRGTLDDAGKLAALAKQSNDPIDIVIHSPGGSVLTGFVFLNAMRDAQAKGVTLNCIVPSYAASMAFIMFAFCDNRYAYKRSMLLFHPMGMGVRGKINAVGAADLSKQFRILSRELDKELSKIMGMKRRVYNNLNSKEFFWTASELKKITRRGFITLIDNVKGEMNIFRLNNRRGPFAHKTKINQPNTKPEDTCSKCHTKPHKDKNKFIFPRQIELSK